MKNKSFMAIFLGASLAAFSVAYGSFRVAVDGGQTLVKNPDRPSNQASGRIVKLIERMRIRDDGKEIVFKYPYQLQVGDDGAIHFANNFEHFKYDPQGRFVYRIVKNGQGPGEAMTATRALLTKDGVIIQAVNPPKLMRFGLKGEYLGEDRTTITRLFEFVAPEDDHIYAFLEENPPYGDVRTPGYFNVPISFCVLSLRLEDIKKPFQFPYRWYLRPGMGWQSARFDVAYKDPESIYVVHGIDYRIDQFNPRRNTVVRSITRKYDRVKRPPEDRTAGVPQGARPPAEEFYYDISKILIAGEDLWVITSAGIGRRSRLVDVFDSSGRYVDNFYLEFPSGIEPPGSLLGKIALKEGFLYSIDQDAEGYFSIAKYEISDPGKGPIKKLPN
jgi:hypothetical protein